jgi:hypothetical protein
MFLGDRFLGGGGFLDGGSRFVAAAGFVLCGGDEFYRKRWQSKITAAGLVVGDDDDRTTYVIYGQSGGHAERTRMSPRGGGGE